MSADKRSTHTDALASLGTLELGENPGRDAIHLAVLPVVAGELLVAGQHVGLVDGKAYTSAKSLGIVDPFLKEVVHAGVKFWLIVYPRQITSLRHVWSHPDFSEESTQPVFDKATSEQWLRDWCDTHDAPSYEHVMAVCEAICDGKSDLPVDPENDYGRSFDQWDDHITFVGVDSHTEVPDEFWVHFEVVTGKRMPTRITYFSCTC